MRKPALAFLRVVPTWQHLLLIALALGLLLLFCPGRPAAELPAASTDKERVALGRLSYLVHCASCHGESGRGDGPMARFLKLAPTDLTHLAASRQGRFPRTEVYEAIDGRREVRGHGPGTMPGWGATFQDRGRDVPQENAVNEQILDLLAYLESIQRVSKLGAERPSEGLGPGGTSPKRLRSTQ